MYQKKINQRVENKKEIKKRKRMRSERPNTALYPITWSIKAQKTDPQQWVAWSMKWTLRLICVMKMVHTQGAQV